MRTTTKVALLPALLLMACEAKVTVEHQDVSPSPTARTQDGGSPDEGGETVENTPALSVFRNWGTTPSHMTLDFSNGSGREQSCNGRSAPSCQYRVDAARKSYFEWYQWPAGQIGVPGLYQRLCVGRITFTGTESQGTIVLSEVETPWQISALDAFPSTYCEDHNGSYTFEVRPEGLMFEGALYPEVDD